MTNPNPILLPVAAVRAIYAKLVTFKAGVRDSRIIRAFGAVPREQFVEPGPWKVFTLGGGYIETPSDDPAFLYQDELIALSGDRGINNGKPSLHARCLAALGVRPGARSCMSARERATTPQCWRT